LEGLTKNPMLVSQPNDTWGAIEHIWNTASAWPEFTQAMRLALTSGTRGRDTTKWAELPGLCCLAAGGDPRSAAPIAAAWLLFYTAAAIMDHVEDKEEPDPWWAELGAGPVINVATGLYFSACLALSQLDKQIGDPETVTDIRSKVLDRFLAMCSGQHFDLTRAEPTLEQYWEISQAKSGAFFTLACWAGARLATSKADVLDGFIQFGEHIGLMVQILDDLEDFRELEKRLRRGDLDSLSHALPVIYVREVCPLTVKDQFNDLLLMSGSIPGAVEKIYQIVESSGGVLYLLAELEKHRSLALEGLERTCAVQPAKQSLVSLLEYFVPQ
jgi:geranylgeranyl pyrophosphate synthase